MNEAIFNPYNRIMTARELLAFGLRLCDALKRGEIDEAVIIQDTTVDGIKITPQWTSKVISDNTGNLRLCLLGMCFMVFDEALDDEFGSKPEIFSDTDIDSLRAIIYMLRCAIAHGIMVPRWRVTHSKYRKKFRISEIDYEIDITNLDGRILNSGDYGSLPGLVKLLDYTKLVIKRHQEEVNHD